MIKKYAILSLLVFVLIQAISLSNLDYFAHNVFKHISLSKSESDHLVTLTLSLENYKSNRIDDDEIIINNKLYDIINESVKGNNVVLKLYSDTKEKSFSEKIKNLKKKNNSSKNKIPTDSKIFFCYNISNNITTRCFYYKSNFTIAYSSKTIDDISIGITIPPPKVA